MTNGEEGIDLLMVMKQATNKNLATVRIQVKNYKNMITERALNELFKKLDVRRCVPVATFEEEPFSVAMVIQVGSGGIHQSSEIKQLGRHTGGSGTPFAKQLQVGCQINGKYKEHLRAIAGEAVSNFVGSSFIFRNKEWHGGSH